MSLQDLYTAFYECGEVSGQRFDSKGSYHLTDNNFTGVATGIVGNGADLEVGSANFLSSTDAIFNIGDIAFFGSYWFKPESLNGTLNAMVSKWAVDGNNLSFLSFINESGQFQFNITSDGSPGTAGGVTALGPAASVGSWSFVVFWHDPTANTINIKVNDTATYTLSRSTGIYAGSTEPFCVGRSHGVSTYDADGVIDNIGFGKNVIPSASEITQLYNGGNSLSWAAMGPQLSDSRAGKSGFAISQPAMYGFAS